MKKTLVTLAIMSAFAEAPSIAEETERYTILRSADGYVRTNTATGAISTCTEKNNQLVCRMAVDDRQAYEADITALETKIDSLEKRIASLEKGSSPSAAMPPVADEQEFQTSLNRMEQFFRRFMGIVKEFQGFGTDAAPVPDRT